MSKLIIHEGTVYKVTDQQFLAMLLDRAHGKAVGPAGLGLGMALDISDLSPEQAKARCAAHFQAKAEALAKKKLDQALGVTAKS